MDGAGLVVGRHYNTELHHTSNKLNKKRGFQIENAQQTQEGCLFANKKHMSNPVQEFNDYRAKMNEVILGKQNKVINRLFNLDTNTYMEGALPVKTKELLGLMASMVLRCDDCIKYHLGKCHEQGVSTDELYETFAIANIVGGTIVIPHTRRAAEYWEALMASH
jgi:AhpD family alkylhydroperoxidase